MTLYRQLLILIAGMILTIFVGTYWVNVDNARRFIVEQLTSHAEDAATALGLSLTHAVDQQDVASMELLIDSLFDHGYYAEITLTGTDAEVLVSRRREMVIAEVPSLFVRALPLEPPAGRAVVMSGWSEIGHVTVLSHPGYAYAQLWHTATGMLLWFALTALVLALFGSLLLRRLLDPLHAVERQAEAVADRRYDVELALPRTRELRTVVAAMNRMTRKVRQAFEEQSRSAGRLRDLAYGDPLTGLGNRRYFDAQLQARLAKDESATGFALLLVHLEGLQTLNDSFGFPRGDALLCAAAELLTKLCTPHDGAALAHLSGADFGILIPLISDRDAEQIAAEICLDLAVLHQRGLSEETNVVHVGLTFQHGATQAGELMAAADLALRSAQSTGPNTWRSTTVESEHHVLGRANWAQLLRNALDQQSVLLYAQPVRDLRTEGAQYHREILARLPDDDGRPLSAGLVMPMAEELGLTRELERAILRKAFAQLSRQPREATFAINLAPASLRDPDMLAWLLEQVAGWPDTAARLCIELPESAVLRSPREASELCHALRDRGVAFGLDHFGQSFSSFGYLKSLRPDYVKIDAAYSGKLAEDIDNRFFVETLIGVAHSLDIHCIAEAIEEQVQLEVLQQLGADGIQGYLIGRPEPLLDP